MESREEDPERDPPSSPSADGETDSPTTTSSPTTTASAPASAATSTVAALGAAAATAREDQTDEPPQRPPGSKSTAEDQSCSSGPSTPAKDRPAPPSSLAVSGSRPQRRRILVPPALSLSLGHSDSAPSDDHSSTFLSPSLDDDTGLDFDLETMDTPSDSESLYDLDGEDDPRCPSVSSCGPRAHNPSPGSQSRPVLETDQAGLGSLEQDMVDSQGTKWRCFPTGQPSQESRVNMSVLEPYLCVLSHGGYCDDSRNDIIIFSSCFLPESKLENYQYVMDNLFRYLVGTLELMVTDNYVMVYLCAGDQKDRLPGIGWLRECYTTIDRRLRKNLKALYVVHPTWYIKALITIIKPFISSKFSKKLQFVEDLQDLSDHIPTEHVQIPDCVRQHDQSLTG